MVLDRPKPQLETHIIETKGPTQSNVNSYTDNYSNNQESESDEILIFSQPYDLPDRSSQYFKV